MSDIGRSVFVVVGGVPGAGKSTLLRRLRMQYGDDVRVIDPEYLQEALARLLPSVPYRRYRWLVHSLTQVWVWAWLLAGPSAGPLVVHDTALRPARRARWVWLARHRGWSPRLLLIEVAKEEALAGQRARGRMVASFERLWGRWDRQLPLLLLAAAGQPREGWDAVRFTDRRSAPAALALLLGKSGEYAEAEQGFPVQRAQLLDLLPERQAAG